MRDADVAGTRHYACRGNFFFAVRTNKTGKAVWGNVRAGSKMLTLGPCSDAFRVRAPLGARQDDG
jgi:hypothetical protein